MDQAKMMHDRLPKGLANFSLALGAAEVLAPRLLARAIGVRAHPALMRAMGLRELASGIGILSKPRSAWGPGSRTAGDAMDLAFLGMVGALPRGRRWRMVALLAVAGVAALDLYTTRKLAARRRDFLRRRAAAPTPAAEPPHVQARPQPPVPHEERQPNVDESSLSERDFLLDPNSARSH